MKPKMENILIVVGLVIVVVGLTMKFAKKKGQSLWYKQRYSSKFLQRSGGLVANPVAYKYSPAKYYIGGMQSEYPIDSE
jgi:hypothetical protein